MFPIFGMGAVVLSFLILSVVVREEKLVEQGKVPTGRLRRLWMRSDSRRAPRFRVDWTVRYRRMPESAAAPASQAATDNISRSGIGVMILEKIPVGSLLELEIAFPDRSVEAAAPVRATVVWIKEMPAGEKEPRRFFAGLHFEPLSEPFAADLREALRTRE